MPNLRRSFAILAAASACGVLILAALHSAPSKGTSKSRSTNVSRSQRTAKVRLGSAFRKQYGNWARQVTETDLIVIGTAGEIVRQGRAPWDYPKDVSGGFGATIRNFHIESVVLGSISETELTLIERGAVVKDVFYGWEGEPRLTTGCAYLLFLRSAAADPKSVAAGYAVVTSGVNVYRIGDINSYFLVNGPQSVVMFENGRSRVPYDEFQSANEIEIDSPHTPLLYGRTAEELVADLKLVIDDVKAERFGPFASRFR